MREKIKQLREKLNSLSSAQKKTIFFIALLLLAVPLTVVVAGIQQEIRQRAYENPVTPPFPYVPTEEPTATPYVNPFPATVTPIPLIPIPQGQCPTGSTPQCIGKVISGGKNATCYDLSKNPPSYAGDICLYSCGSCGFITPTPKANPTNMPNPPTYGTCPSGTVRTECIGYTANNANTYCWGPNNTYLGSIMSVSCNPTPTITQPGPTTNACPDECYSDDLRTKVGKSNGVCNSGVSSVSHLCPSNDYNGKTYTCNGKTYTCNGYWQ